MASRKRRPTKKAFENHPNYRERGANGCFVSKQLAPPKSGAQVAVRQPVGDASLMTGLEPTVDLAALERLPLLELGATGLRHYGGVIDEEFLPALRGRRAIQVYTEMRDNDPTIGAIMFAVEMLMRNVEWRTEPGGDQPADLELAEFVDSCRGDMSETWNDTLSSILSFLPFGWSLHEEVYKKRDGANVEDPSAASNHDDGRIGWRKLPVRAQDTLHRWIFDELRGDELRGMVQIPPPTYTFRTIPAQKFLLFRTTAAKGNPQGRSVLRNAYRPWYFKRHIEEVEGIGIERDLAGLPKMEVPAELLDVGATPDKKALAAEIRAMLRDVRRDEREGILVPREFDKDGNARYAFDLVRSGGRRQFDTVAIVNRYDRLIASTVMADFILLGQQRVGALSLAESKTELFGYALGAWLDAITQLFNRQGIPRLLAHNGIRTDSPPRFVHGDIETVDLKELGDYVAKLTGAGMPLFPDEEVENQLRLQGGLPEKSEEAAAAQEEAERKAEEQAATERAAAEAAAERLAAERAGAEGGPEETGEGA